MSKVSAICISSLTDLTAVTLDGTIIHKSGLITGGHDSRNNGKVWEEHEVEGNISNNVSTATKLMQTRFASIAD